MEKACVFIRSIFICWAAVTGPHVGDSSHGNVSPQSGGWSLRSGCDGAHCSGGLSPWLVDAVFSVSSHGRPCVSVS